MHIDPSIEFASRPDNLSIGTSEENRHQGGYPFEFTDKKIITTISKTMNNIDMRLVSYHNYVNSNLEINEIQKFKSSLKNR